LTACSMNSGWPSYDQNRLLACAEALELRADQRIGDVKDIEGDAARAEHVGKTEDLERPQGGIVHAALNDDADVPGIAVKQFIELMLLDEAHRRRPALLDFLLLVQIACRRQHDPAGIPDRMLECVPECERRAHVVARREAARQVAGPDPQLQHHRRVGGFRQLEAIEEPSP
jgi:hypothetical protein